MDELTKLRIAALARCTFPIGSWDKRFVRSVWGMENLTEKQLDQIPRLAYKYRRQMPAHLVPEEKP